MTYKEFEKKYLGKAVDYDKVAGVQCVDLVDQYLKECFGITGVWVNGAKDLYNKFDSYPALKQNFARVPNTKDLVIREGDIIVWGGGSWGHTGIGTGVGDKDYFVSLEENTLGCHEPTQKVKHYFNGSGGNDGCNPVLGVLRPKSQKQTLDTTGFKLGDRGNGVLAYKQLLIAAKAAGIITQSVDNNGTYGDGTEKATNEVLKAGGYYPNGIAGEKTIQYLGKLIKGSV